MQKSAQPFLHHNLSFLSSDRVSDQGLFTAMWLPWATTLLLWSTRWFYASL